MSGPVSDQNLLMMLEGNQPPPQASGGVTDPAILQQLNGAQQAAPQTQATQQQFMNPPQNSDNIATELAAPVSGFNNEMVNSLLGATQGIGNAIMPQHVHVPAWVPGIGGSDIGAENGNAGINEIKKQKDQMIADFTEGQPKTQDLMAAGGVGADVAQFMGASELMPLKYAEALRAVKQLGLGGRAAGAAAEAATFGPSVTAGALTSGAQPTENQDQRISNMMWGGGAAGLGEGVGKAISSEVTDPAKKAVMAIADKYDVPVFRNQLWDKGNPGKFATSLMRMLPGGGAESRIAGQTEDFNNRVMQEVGGSGNVSPEKVADQFDVNSKGFQTLMPKYNVPVNKAFRTDMAAALKDPTFGKLTSEKQGILDQHLQAINDAVQNATTGAPSAGQGVIPGADLHNIQSSIGADLRGANTSPQLGRLRDFLHDRFEGAVTDPNDLGQYTKLRQQYRDLLVLDHVVGQTPNAVMQPAQLQAAAKKIYKDYGYANTTNGATGMAQLARLGDVLKDNVRSSGTAENTSVKDFLKHAGSTLTGAAVGAGVGEEEDGGHGALIGAGIGIPLAYAMSHGVVNPYLFTKMQTNPSVAKAMAPALANALYNHYGTQ